MSSSVPPSQSGGSKPTQSGDLSGNMPLQNNKALAALLQILTSVLQELPTTISK